jgi:hypothetical protein
MNSHSIEANGNAISQENGMPKAQRPDDGLRRIADKSEPIFSSVSLLFYLRRNFANLLR